MDNLRVILLGGYAGDGWISIGRYQKELARTLQALPGEPRLELTSWVPDPGPVFNGLRSAGPLGAKAASYWSQFVVYPRHLSSVSGDIYHFVNQSLSHLLGKLDPSRTVITCHDLLHFPLWRQRRRQSPWPWATDRFYRFCVGQMARCARVIAVSQKNKEDAVKYLGCDPARITVVHEGVSPAFRAAPDPRRVEELRAALKLPPGPVLLHVGVPVFYKNMEGLFRALAELRHRLRCPATLLRAGPPLTRSQEQLAQTLGIADAVREMGFQDDRTLTLLYRLADCFVFPSLYEGFGFPPLEAMACGLPVVASDRGSLPEILGDAALLVDPENPLAIAKAAQRVLEDPALRERLRARGLERSKPFSWERCAEETLEVYRQVLA